MIYCSVNRIMVNVSVHLTPSGSDLILCDIRLLENTHYSLTCSIFPMLFLNWMLADIISTQISLLTVRELNKMQVCSENVRSDVFFSALVCVQFFLHSVLRQMSFCLLVSMTKGGTLFHLTPEH